jgi:hypothetical protein
MTKNLRLLVSAVLVPAALLAGCGGGSDSRRPLEAGLSYLPADAPVVISVDTDVEGRQAKAIEKIVRKFPFAGQIEQGLRQSIQDEGLNFEKDLKPILGNEFVIGATDIRQLGSDEDDQAFVGALQVKDKDKLQSAVERGKSKEIGEKSGAKLYEGLDGDVFAIDDNVLVVADTRRLLEAALDRSEGDDHLKQEDFDEATADLPKDAILRVSADLRQAIQADPDARDARKVKWVSALRDLGLTASAQGDAIKVDFAVKTEGDLSERDLPFAAGAESPQVVEREGGVGVGVRGLRQILTFAESAGQAVNPSDYGDYETAKSTLERRLGVDVERDILDQVEDDVSANISLDGKFGLRAKLKDPAEFERTLDKLGKAIPSLGGDDPLGYSAPKGEDGFYAIASGDDTIVYRVADGELVLANDPKRAGEMTAATPEDVRGAEGSIAVQADAEQLVTQAIARAGGGLGGALGGALFAGPLGEVTGSMAVSPDELTGNFTLGFD